MSKDEIDAIIDVDGRIGHDVVGYGTQIDDCDRHTEGGSPRISNIGNQRARGLASELAARRRISMTDAVIGALEAELRREREKMPLADRLARISDELPAKARPGGHDMGKDEIDAMWSHSP